MNQEEKRESIKKIKLDQNLTEKEKNIHIQKLFSSNYLDKIQSVSNFSTKCSHYEKKCYAFKFTCCNLIDPCKRCHMERNTCKPEDIKVIGIKCCECEMEQELSNCCKQCCVQFAPSHCVTCQIWTSKQIHHCVDCGICRVGNANTLYHCVKCGLCYNKLESEDENSIHKCINKTNVKITDEQCVVCAESIFNYQSESFYLNCLHIIHTKCFNEYISQGKYNCPHCKKSICDLTAQWNLIREQIKLYPVPNEMIPIELNDIVDTPFGKFLVKKINIVNENKMFEGEFIDFLKNSHKKIKFKPYGILNYQMVKKNLYKQIHCNDCEKKSLTPFHFYGLECLECGSFNTQE